MHWKFLVALGVVVLVGCGSGSEPPRELRLVSTHTLQDSGLLDVLLPHFEQESGLQVQAVIVGSGQALELGRRGDADVLFTHSPQAEQEFVGEGFGLERLEIMKNDFVFLGPPGDPAQLRAEKIAAAALQRLAEAKSPFISRGDKSGTHTKELSLWKAAEREPTGEWYIAAGSGMAQTLRMAHEKRAYTLADRATFLTLQDELDLEIVLEGDPALENIYSLIVVNPAKHPHVKREAAERFAAFLRSEAGRDAIARFGVEKFGQPLFSPLPLE